MSWLEFSPAIPLEVSADQPEARRAHWPARRSSAPPWAAPSASPLPPPAPVPRPPFAPAHCAPSTRPAPAKPPAQEIRNEEQLPPEVRSSSLRLLFVLTRSHRLSRLLLRLGNSRRQSLQFGAIQHLRIHHAHQQRLHRSFAEPVHNALHCPPRHLLPRLSRPIHKGAVIDRVRQVALFLQPPQHRSHRRVFQRAVQLLAGRF